MNKPKRLILNTILLLVILQGVREGLEYCIAKIHPLTSFGERMVTMSVMALLAVVVIIIAKRKKVPLSVFPEHFSKRYIVLTCVAALLLILNPYNFAGGYQAIMLTIYGSIVTPIYEELLFRGYIWNRCEVCFDKVRTVFIWNVVLFSLWHLGYMIPQLMDGNLTAVLWKLAAGLGYGIVLGLVRMKTKNCYSTMVTHGLLNLFMI